MNKILFFLTFWSVMFGNLQAQDFKPGQQAQGYLDSKNVTVDYSTGIFHYNVPLFELNSGNFKLPVSLNYTAKGVKPNDHPGICGYNWNLQAGGVVTRTIRGGIADEIAPYGYANFYPSPSTGYIPLEEDSKNINMHKRDGESDVFTAVFNGQSVQFIITNNGTSKFKIEPLEKTNIKIDYEWDSNNCCFSGWIITDENGIRYFYRIAEWTRNITKTEPVGFNNIFNKSYISSWYISEIQIPGASPIIFTYDDQYSRKKKGEQIEPNSIKHVNNSQWTIFYGNSIMEHPLNFSKYQMEFENCINNARNEINFEQVAYQVNMLFEKSSLLSSPTELNQEYFRNATSYKINEQILGCLSDLKSVVKVSYELIGALKSVISECNESSFARNHLHNAIACVNACLQECVYQTEKTEFSSTAWQIYPPLLTQISNGNNEIILKYGKRYENSYYNTLDTLILLDDFKNISSQIVLSKDNLLRNISWYGNNHQLYQKQSFTYHLEKFPKIIDLWEDYALSSNAPAEFSHNVVYSKSFSLQSITTPTGGEIQIDYERNRYESRGFGIIFPADYSGIRIKEMVLKDKTGNIDTIRYHYPYCGALIYEDVNRYESLTYPQFEDFIQYDKVQYRGNILTNIGNNGLFYHYVEEELVGKGYNTYLFSIPPQYYYEAACPFQICGLPLAKGVYNNTGNLIHLQKNKYYADGLLIDRPSYFEDWTFDLAPWIEPSPTGFCYSKKQLQVKANRFYIDRETADKYYRDQSENWIYSNIPSPYELYEYNLESRTYLICENPLYEFYYGGKTVLKEQKEYDFTGIISTKPDIEHLTGNLPNNYILQSYIEYFYDNHMVNHHPTRIVHHQANGDKQIIQRRTALDISSTEDPVITAMRSANVVAPVIKEQYIIEKAGTIKCLEEKINLFQILNDSVVLPEKMFRYIPAQTNSITPVTDSLDNKLFSVDKLNYRMEQQTVFAQKNDKYLPETQVSNTDTLQLFFDKDVDNQILQVHNIDRNVVDVIDSYSTHKLNPSLSPEAKEEIDNYISSQDFTQLSKFLNIHDSIVINECSAIFQENYNSAFYRNYVQFVRLLDEHSNDNQIFSLADSVIASDYDMIWMFSIFTRELSDRYSEEDFYIIHAQVYSSAYDLVYNPEYYPYFPQNKNNESATKLIITPTVSQQKYQVYLVTFGQPLEIQFQPTYQIKQGNTKTLYQIPIQTITPNQWQVSTFEIDLSNYANVTSLQVDTYYQEVCTALAVIVPVGTPFEAISYRADGLPFCKLNQTGQLERYEYDGAGRIIKIFDQHGNLLKENHYNLVNK